MSAIRQSTRRIVSTIRTLGLNPAHTALRSPVLPLGIRHQTLLPSLIFSRSYAAKKKSSKGSKSTAAVEEDDYVDMHSKTGKKGKGKGKSNSAFMDDDELDSTEKDDQGSFDLPGLEKNMDEVIDKLRVGLKNVVGRVGRVSAG